MKKLVAIIQCDLVLNRCSGFGCTQWFYDRKGSFEPYGSDVQYIPISCGGCCGKGLTARIENLGNRMSKMAGLKKEDVAVHLSSCMVKDNHHSDRCPHVDIIKGILAKHGFDEPVEGTYISKASERKREQGIYRSY